MSTVYASNSSLYNLCQIHPLCQHSSQMYAANLSVAFQPSDSPHGVEGGPRLPELLDVSWEHGGINFPGQPQLI